jgi:hypothetical protein
MAPPLMAGLLIFVRLPKPQKRYSRNRLPGISVELAMPKIYIQAQGVV